MAWITTKTGKRINTDWFDEDEKKKQRQIKNNEEQGKEKTTAQNLEDKYKHINPHYNKDARYNFENGGYNNNCVMCAIAFEANMRGQDVEANPFKFGDNDALEKSKHPEKAFGYKTGDVWDVGRPKREQVVREIELTLAEDWGPGSRGIIQNETAHQRHAMNVINLNGKIIVIDPETSRHGSVAEMLKGLSTKDMKLFRTDNQDMNDSYSQWAYKKRS